MAVTCFFGIRLMVLLLLSSYIAGENVKLNDKSIRKERQTQSNIFDRIPPNGIVQESGAAALSQQSRRSGTIIRPAQITQLNQLFKREPISQNTVSNQTPRRQSNSQSSSGLRVFPGQINASNPSQAQQQSPSSTSRGTQNARIPTRTDGGGQSRNLVRRQNPGGAFSRPAQQVRLEDIRQPRILQVIRQPNGQQVLVTSQQLNFLQQQLRLQQNQQFLRRLLRQQANSQRINRQQNQVANSQRFTGQFRPNPQILNSARIRLFQPRVTQQVQPVFQQNSRPQQLQAQFQPRPQQQSQSQRPQFQQFASQVQQSRPQFQTQRPQIQQFRPQPQTQRPQIQQFRPQPQTQRPQIQQFRPQPQTQRPQIQQFRPQPQTQRPQIQQFRPQPQTQRPQIQQFRPQPQTQRPQIQFRPQPQTQRPQIQQFRPQPQTQRPQIQQFRPQLQTQRPQIQQFRPQPQTQRPQLQQFRPQIQQSRPQIQQPIQLQQRPQFIESQPITQGFTPTTFQPLIQGFIPTTTFRPIANQRPAIQSFGIPVSQTQSQGSFSRPIFSNQAAATFQRPISPLLGFRESLEDTIELFDDSPERPFFQSQRPFGAPSGLPLFTTPRPVFAPIFNTLPPRRALIGPGGLGSFQLADTDEIFDDRTFEDIDDNFTIESPEFIF